MNELILVIAILILCIVIYRHINLLKEVRHLKRIFEAAKNIDEHSNYPSNHVALKDRLEMYKRFKGE